MSKRRGFTLIELLVVVAIIALLISILLPSLNQAREQAKQVVCAANLKTQGTGMAQYTMETDHFPASYYTGGVYGEARRTGVTWAPRIRAYLNDQALDRKNANLTRQDKSAYGPEVRAFWCPSVKKDWQNWRPVISRRDVWDSPDEAAAFGYAPNELPLQADDPIPYGYNDWGESDNGWEYQYNLGLGAHAGETEANKEAGRPRVRGEQPVSRVRQPAEMIAVADSTPDNFWDSVIDPFDFAAGDERPSRRHNGGCSVMFADGHVAYLKFENIASKDPWLVRRWNYTNLPVEVMSKDWDQHVPKP